jgi:hypothetical protein
MQCKKLEAVQITMIINAGRPISTRKSRPLFPTPEIVFQLFPAPEIVS